MTTKHEPDNSLKLSPLKKVWFCFLILIFISALIVLVINNFKHTSLLSIFIYLQLFISTSVLAYRVFVPYQKQRDVISFSKGMATLSILLIVAIPIISSDNFSCVLRRCFDCNSKADLRNVYLACKAYWAEEGSDQLCGLGSIPVEKYGYIQSKGVHVKLSGNEINFLAKASHLESENIFAIDAKGNITESNPVASDSFHAMLLANRGRRDLSKVSDWINRSENINKPDDFNRYPIHLVSNAWRSYSSFHMLPLIQLLVEKGADVNVANVSGNTPLHIATEMGNEPLVNFLLDHGADAKAKNNIGDTPLHSAGRKRIGIKNLSLVKRLLSKGVNIDHLNDRNESAILISARNGNQGLVQSLIEAGANVDGKDSDGFTLLHFDIDTKLVEVLLKKGLDINAKSNNGQTPLHSSRTKVASPEKAELLIQHGAEINAKDNKGDTPLISILRFANHHRNIKKVARLLILSGADVNAGRSESPLYLAVKNAPHRAPFPIVELLLQKGADINKANSHMQLTPLHIAKSIDMIRYLLDHKANMYAEDKNGNTPFQRRLHNVEMIKLLIEKGFDVNFPNQKGETPLQIAYQRKYQKKVIKFLIEQGATLPPYLKGTPYAELYQ